MGIKIVISNGQKDLVKVVHDWGATDGLIRVGMPAVLSMKLNQFCDLTEAHQWYMFRTCLVFPFTGYQHWDESKLSKADRDFLMAEWRSYTHGAKFLTNNKGTEEYKDYVSRRNLAVNGLPGLESLTCTGNTHKKAGAEFDLWGDKVTPVYALDFSLPPPDIEKVNPLTHPYVFPKATNVPANKPRPSSTTWTLKRFVDGSWQIDPFPNLAPKDSLFPLVTNGKEAEKLKVIFRDKKLNHVAGRFVEDGVRFAYNYVNKDRLFDVNGYTTPYHRPIDL